MTGDELTEVERWAKAHAEAGSRTARLVLALLALYKAERVARAEQKRVNVALAERVAAQSEILSRRAEQQGGNE